MATNFIKFTRHAVCGTTKLSATRYGAHMFNIKIEKDLDNGSIVAMGDLVVGTLDTYKAVVSTGFAGVIDGIASNGNFYVRVTAPGDAILLHNPELIYEEYTSDCTHASNFYNAKGDIVRGYRLTVGDVFELSAEGFVGTASVGKTVSADTTFKLAVAIA